uniref:Uncharacterized protein n=1 Tax=uncultured bacterium contig00021 TaxID=1181511 RepID=A0A806K297_9BACT|nr:hypothetical protein [uncultured bacterium contig00021]
MFAIRKNAKHFSRKQKNVAVAKPTKPACGRLGFAEARAAKRRSVNCVLYDVCALVFTFTLIIKIYSFII